MEDGCLLFLLADGIDAAAAATAGVQDVCVVLCVRNLSDVITHRLGEVWCYIMLGCCLALTHRTDTHAHSGKSITPFLFMLQIIVIFVNNRLKKTLTCSIPVNNHFYDQKLSFFSSVFEYTLC